MFDYVRFPTDGDMSAAVFPGKRKERKTTTIAEFVKYARYAARAARRARLGGGVRPHGDPRDGDRPEAAASSRSTSTPSTRWSIPPTSGPASTTLDDPNAVPGVTVARALRDFRRALRGRDTVLVPWLQDFSLGRDYSLEDVRAQILAARDAKSGGFLLWNPSGIYKNAALAGS